MNLRTTFKIDPSRHKISYATPVMFTGSCFASEMGEKMAEGKMKVFVNPSGTVYNPVSISNTIRLVTENRILRVEDLFPYKDRYISLLHYTDFTSDNADETLNKINRFTSKAHQFLKEASFLFITFGTSRIYRLVKSGEIVSNCHKLPSEIFRQDILSAEEIVSLWMQLLDMLNTFNKKLRVIFTISPVRHWKDGAHGNQLSKSILFVAVEQLLKHPLVEGYFPAYELLMDDLRDYRYYADDMLHPSRTAIDYVWDAYTGNYFDPAALAMWREVNNITKSMKHRISESSPSSRKEFATSMLQKINDFCSKHHEVDLSGEITYFQDILSASG
ncbi:MAG: GSCFA domain-containing protein [Bacteroidales bacterium]|jgi:hypothetical protein